MRETITLNRIIQCSFANKEVAQQISAYSLNRNDEKTINEILTKYCSGQHSCKSDDCQMVVGLSGKTYTKSIEKILNCFEVL